MAAHVNQDSHGQISADDAGGFRDDVNIHDKCTHTYSGRRSFVDCILVALPPFVTVLICLSSCRVDDQHVVYR